MYPAATIGHARSDRGPAASAKEAGMTKIPEPMMFPATSAIELTTPRPRTSSPSRVVLTGVSLPPMRRLPALLSLALLSFPVVATPRPRARDLGVPFEGTPGAWNAITDVAGVAVGHETLVSGEGKLVVGKGPVRTGVTAIFPRGRGVDRPVPAGWFSLNGNGEMTGTAWIEESGFLEGPGMLPGTHSVGTVRDAVISWRVAHGRADAEGYWWSLPVVAETWDGYLSDINGFHVKERHVFEALSGARGGP